MNASIRESALAAARRGISRNIVLLGYGTIGQCLMPMLRRELELPAAQCTVLDGEDRSGLFRQRHPGTQYRVLRITRDNLGACLADVLAAGDLLVNASVGIDSVELIGWCQRHGVLYVDSSLEPWAEDVWDEAVPPECITEYHHHMRARRELAVGAGNATAVVCHGANPGLVNHFVKAALIEIASAVDAETGTPRCRDDWARLAQRSATRVIHISERDTQLAVPPKRVDEFVNTWSIEGFIEEARMPVELGWGTHERRLPALARGHEDGPGNAIWCARPAAGVGIRSWVPEGGPIHGLALPHSECVTLSDYLTVSEGGEVRYRPSVAFAYMPCDGAAASLHELMMRDWRMQSAQRVLNEDIVSGMDELGILLMGHPLGALWFGSQLDIDGARQVAPGNNPTAVQVAAGMLAAAVWALANPEQGYCEPEALPHEEILATARPYLGTMLSRVTDWTPLRDRRALFGERPQTEDPWQFENFLVE